MNPTTAKDHRVEPRPRGHLPCEQGSPAPPPRSAAHPAVPSPATVDADVTEAVRGVLAGLLDRRTAAAEAVDPLFAEDLAARVAYFTQNGGKFNRSRLLWWAMRACGGTEPAQAQSALRVGAALELIQTCALVHDDVMDGARLRRGRPALHADVTAQYAEITSRSRSARLGQAAAILAGDLALVWADDVVADTGMTPESASRVRELWRSMRMEMVAGQYLDVHGEATSVRSLVRAVRAACLKSALYSVERPIALGAALAGADPVTTRALCSAGRCVGFAFQLRDDLLDAFGEPGDTGKPSGGDIRSGKPTYLAAVAQARAESTGDRHALAVLRDTLGREDASEAELTAVRRVFTATGARDTVESKIGRLVAQGLRHLDSAVLEPHGRSRLRSLLRSAAGEGDDGGPGEVVPSPLRSAAMDEGARR
ncbi:polyprenyl synthetase family protein [Streptomyces sp. NPDC005374]|uniref:polyprenyl synthetase family protein n=1 Tax=Streptomyces sp. NPDC005374 TaxID=3364713 RepID=UPI0036D14331